MSKETGGPAFPVEHEGHNRYESKGVTVRDYFAAKAMQGMLANSNTTGFDALDVVDAAWMFADSMLAKRAK